MIIKKPVRGGAQIRQQAPYLASLCMWFSITGPNLALRPTHLLLPILSGQVSFLFFLFDYVYMCVWVCVYS